MRRPVSRPASLLHLRRPRAVSVVSFLVVAGVMGFTLAQLHPSLLLANTTVAGGDTGSQVGLPYYFEHGILTHLRLTGWSPWWYAGYPQYTFYFLFPAILVTILNAVMPYNVAFKLITVSGSLLLPIVAYSLGRLARMRRPGPECLAIFTLPYLFDTSYQIFGGNLASTLAGEYSYSLSLSVGLLFLGVVIRGLDTGKRRGLAAVLLAITALCHIVPAIFVGVVAAIITISRLDRHRLWWGISAGAAGVAILGFWVVPFVVDLPYTSSLGFQRLTTFGASMFPSELLWAVVLAVIGAVTSIVRRRRLGGILVMMAVVSAAMVVLDPVSSLYNARFLPFWILCVYLLAGVGVAELATLAAEGWTLWRSRGGDAKDLGKAVLAALGAVEAEAAGRLAAQPELARAIADAHPALARSRDDVTVDPTEWGAEARERARIALALDPALAEAYEVKEAFVTAVALAVTEPDLAMPAMDLWSALAQGSGLTSYSKLGRQLVVWRPELEAHLTPERTLWQRSPRKSAMAAAAADPGPAASEAAAEPGAAGAVAGDPGARASARPRSARQVRDQRAFTRGRPRPARQVRDPRSFTRARPITALVAPVVAWIGVAAFVAVPLGISWMPISTTSSFIPDWINWNYTGYQGKTTWPEYHAINTTMVEVGAKYGCGRAMWEYGPELNDLGTPEALMLLPFWTKGCIDSMEGLLFESSATTPYHFINQAELSETPSEAEAGLPYGPLDVAEGIQHLQLLGVKYYMAFTPQAEAQASADPALTRIATTGPWPTVVGDSTIDRTWDVYLVAGSTTVTPLDTQPVVLTGVDKRSAQDWLNVSLAWYDDPSKWNVMLAESGPSSWKSVSATDDSSPPATSVTPTTVSKIVNTNDTISFDVTRLGSPVLVKTSYFPNWKATGATGPYRVAPNEMVVVPTSHHVTLTYGRTGADWVGLAFTIAGLAGAAFMAWRPPVPLPPPVRPEPPEPVATEPAPEPELTGVDAAVG